MVEYVNYKGEKYPVRVYYKSIMLFQKETGKTIDKVDNDLEALGVLFYYALQRGYEIEGKVFKLTKEDAVDMLDECWFEFLAAVFKFFPTAEKVGNGEDTKKKMK